MSNLWNFLKTENLARIPETFFTFLVGIFQPQWAHKFVHKSLMGKIYPKKNLLALGTILDSTILNSILVPIVVFYVLQIT